MSSGNPLGYPVGQFVAKFGIINAQAAYTNYNLYTHQGVSTGLYRVTWYACLMKAAGASSWVGGVNGFQLVYNPSEAGPSVTSPASPLATGQYNTVGTTIGSGITMCAVAPGGLIGFSFGFSTSGIPSAVYAIHIRVEYLGDITPFGS